MSKSPNKDVREYFMSRFSRYLVHIEGGAHSSQQAPNHTRQVYKILTFLDFAGSDLACLAHRNGVDVWDKFCVLPVKP